MANPGLTFQSPRGRPPVLEWIAPQELQVDDSYQRSLEAENSQALIRKIAQRWDWGLCQPINVARRTDGSLWIVDGQHRRAAAMLRGDIAHLPCVIATFADLGAEAAAFVALNRQRRALGSVDAFKAALVAGDADARGVMMLITDAGLSLAPHSNYTAWKPAMLYCVPTIQAGYRRHGARIAAKALKALAAAYANQVLQYAGNLLEGMVLFLAAEPVSVDALAQLLLRHSQLEWVRRGRARMVDGDNRKEAMRAALAAEWRGPEQQHARLPDSALPPIPGGGPARPTFLRPAETAWCEQCDAKVSGARAAICTDPFCKLKQAEAAE